MNPLLEAVKIVYSEGEELLPYFGKKPPKEGSITLRYNVWYTKALALVRTLAPDRLEEFVAYYQRDDKRKAVNMATYTIQDMLNNIGSTTKYDGTPHFDARSVASFRFLSQLNIITALATRADGVFSNLLSMYSAKIHDNTLEQAQELMGTNLRAAGVVAGVVLEAHLQKVCENKLIKITKKHPTIADMNDPLKSNGVIDQPQWRKVQYLADIRNKCCHHKSGEPTKEEVAELIGGVNWALKTVN